MTRFNKLLVVGLLVGFIAETYALDESEFKISTFDEIIKSNGVSLQDKAALPNTFAESPTNPGFSVIVKYQGKSRDLSQPIKMFFQIPSQAMAARKEFFANYTKEILVSENKINYWIPIQKQVFPFIEKEVKRGEAIKILIRYYGTLVGKSAKHSSPIFLMMDFEKPNR